jgi:hypothetical protein
MERAKPTQNKKAAKSPVETPQKLPISLCWWPSVRLPHPPRRLSGPRRGLPFIPFRRGRRAAPPTSRPDGRLPRTRHGHGRGPEPRPARPRVPPARLRSGPALPVLVPSRPPGFAPSGLGRSLGSRRKGRAPWSSRRRRPRREEVPPESAPTPSLRDPCVCCCFWWGGCLIPRRFCFICFCLICLTACPLY